MVDLILIIPQLIIFILTVVILILSIKKYIKSRININLFLTILFGIICFTAFRVLLTTHSFVPNQIIIGENLSVLVILTVIILFIPLEFLFYLLRWKKLYSLPIVLGFFIFLNLFLEDVIIFYRIGTIIIGAISFFTLIYEGIKRKNGDIMSFAFVFMYGLAYFPITQILGLTFQFIGLAFLLIGTSGLIDKYVLVDDITQQKVENIKNTWIAKRVQQD
ncbi:MAG: hypothetical protein EU547_05040 [Promethearchaeota archaeon]|nr:MAG: hypothetical protein EU547_05040 [Candidatus Lokiarchaeota archaeon]